MAIDRVKTLAECDDRMAENSSEMEGGNRALLVLTNKNDNSYKSKLANILKYRHARRCEEKHLNISFGCDYTVQQNCSHNNG